MGGEIGVKTVVYNTKRDQKKRRRKNRKKKKKRVEDVMLIATGHKHEELEAKLQVFL